MEQLEPNEGDLDAIDSDFILPTNLKPSDLVASVAEAAGCSLEDAKRFLQERGTIEEIPEFPKWITADTLLNDIHSNRALNGTNLKSAIGAIKRSWKLDNIHNNYKPTVRDLCRLTKNDIAGKSSLVGFGEIYGQLILSLVHSLDLKFDWETDEA